MVTWESHDNKQIKKCKQIVHWTHWSEIGDNITDKVVAIGSNLPRFSQKFRETEVPHDPRLFYWSRVEDTHNGNATPYANLFGCSSETNTLGWELFDCGSRFVDAWHILVDANSMIHWPI